MRIFTSAFALLLVAAILPTAQADTVTAADAITYNRCAQNVGGVIRLINPGGPEPQACGLGLMGLAGTAFVSSPLALTASTSFSASFAYRIWGFDGSNGADGLALVLQNDPRGASAYGAGGGNQGFGIASGEIAIAPLWVVVVDTFNYFEPSGNYIGFRKTLTRTDGAALLAYGEPAYDLNDGSTQYIWVDYSAISHAVNVYASATNIKPLSSLFSVGGQDLTELGSQFYVGFSAGSNAVSNVHDIEQFSLTTTVVPIPPAVLLFGSALGLMGVMRRKISE